MVRWLDSFAYHLEISKISHRCVPTARFQMNESMKFRVLNYQSLNFAMTNLCSCPTNVRFNIVETVFMLLTTNRYHILLATTSKISCWWLLTVKILVVGYGTLQFAKLTSNRFQFIVWSDNIFHKTGPMSPASFYLQVYYINWLALLTPV